MSRSRLAESEEVYNPLDMSNLAASVGLALSERPQFFIRDLPKFRGVGIYALYYHGAHKLYRPIVEWNGGDIRMPLYVGKAVGKGVRKGEGLLDDPQSSALRNRIAKHFETFAATADLKPSDFSVRYLRTMAVWIPLCESSLIALYKPVWNMALDGLGNNDPGAGRYKQERSPWDTVHPGRPWAELCQPNRTSAGEFREKVRAHVAKVTAHKRSPGLAPPQATDDEVQHALRLAEEI